jgi:hypothetical protein
VENLDIIEFREEFAIRVADARSILAAMRAEIRSNNWAVEQSRETLRPPLDKPLVLPVPATRETP